MGGGQGADTTTRLRAGPWEGLDTTRGLGGRATAVVTAASTKPPAGARHRCSSPHCLVLSENRPPALELRTIQPWHLDPGWANSPVWLQPLLPRVTVEPRAGAAVTSDTERVRSTLHGGD